MAKGRKTGGRRPGSVNKVTADIRAMVEEALTRAGGADYLLAQATGNPAAFLQLVGKILPLNVTHSGAIGSYVVAAPLVAPDALTWQQQLNPPTLQ
jgi:hypothetical protein